MNQPSFFSRARKYGPAGALLLAGVALMGRAAFHPAPPASASGSAAASVALWNNIGGCGSSGGGAAAGAGKWIGRGVSGGLVDMEILDNHTLGGDYMYSAVAGTGTFHFVTHPTWTASLATAWKSNEFEYEGYKTASDVTPRLERITGGFGDLGLGVNKTLGNENEHSVGLSVLLPTGQHDIKRLHVKSSFEPDDVRWMNPFVQPGSGLYSLGASYEYTKTKDWGIVIFGASYTSQWAWDNWDCRDGTAGTVNDKVLKCQSDGPSPLTFKVWELQHQDWGADPKQWTDSKGAPGTGATGADGFSFYGYVGHTQESSTQNVGLTLSVPMSPTYYWEYGPETGGNDNRASQRRRTNDYTLKLSTGIEITNPNFPIFMSLGIPWKLNDVVDRGRLVDPQNYVGTIGVRGTFL